MASSSNDISLDDILIFDQGFHSPASASPSTSKMLPSSAFINPQSTYVNDSTEHLQGQYAGPSHNYGQFKQQTGLPSGAMSSVSDSNQMRDITPTYATPTLDSFGNRFDYQDNYSMQDQSSFYLDPMDDSVDPSAIDGTFPSSSNARPWPGMHSQQATAKERAQRQPQAHQPPQLLLQQQLPQDFQQQYQRGQNTEGSEHSSGSSEDQVQDRITRLISQIRHNSTGSLADIEEDNDDQATSLAQRKKAEEDMDDDERLLASEEGKKLSSKERRQLRNKVSARAFRSRRKEYISQLEGDLNAKSTEVSELKTRNRTLLAQNKQLMELAQTMLNHPAFGNFMEDVSRDPSMLDRLKPPQAQEQRSGSSTPQAPAHPVKQEPVSAHPNSATTTSNQHVAVAMMPDQPLDMSMLDLSNTHFQPAHHGVSTFGGFQQPQVFAVFETTMEGPSPSEMRLPALLSGKQENNMEEDGDDESKAASPSFDERELSMLQTSVTESRSEKPALPACELESSHPAYDLYCSGPEVHAIVPRERPTQLFPKAPQYSLNVVADKSCDSLDEQAANEIDILFASVENGCMKRISRMIEGL